MRWPFVLLLFLLSPGAAAQSLTDQQKREIVERTATAYADGYVFADKGQTIASALRERMRGPGFGNRQTTKEFAGDLTATIRRAVADRHIEVLPPEPNEVKKGPEAEPTRAERLGWVERLRRRNYDFVRVERLAGNVGLLQLNSFPPPELAGDTAEAAMAFLKNSDALIIDLRENGGGTGDMVRLLASYFFVEPTRLSRTVRRNREPRVSFDMTLSSLPGDRMPVIDLYVLTSSKTFSAAEAFAFALQENDRAIIVGETSGGGGNAGDYVDVGHGFRAFVPDVHVASPYREASWEGRGVAPAIEVPAARALAAAHREAVKRLAETAVDPARRQALYEVLRQLPQ